VGRSAIALPVDEHCLGLDDCLSAGYGGDAAECPDGIGHVVQDAEIEHDIPCSDRAELRLPPIQGSGGPPDVTEQAAAAESRSETLINKPGREALSAISERARRDACVAPSDPKPSSTNRVGVRHTPHDGRSPLRRARTLLQHPAQSISASTEMGIGARLAKSV
jgi:hypothetical protein